MTTINLYEGTQMNAAQAFIDALGSENSNDVYDALKAAEHVNESQDWDNGKSTWTFADGSAIMMEGADVYVLGVLS